MKYFKQYYGKDEKPFEITKKVARETLDGFWTKDSLDDIFNNDIGFRLNTPFAEVWTMNDDGLVPMAGFYGTVG